MVIFLIVHAMWSHYRLSRTEKAVRWILEHVRIVTQQQEDAGYARIRELFGIKDDE
jgi:hypothetical protein